MIFNGGSERPTGTTRVGPARSRARLLAAVLVCVLAVLAMAGCTSGATDKGGDGGADGGPGADKDASPSASPSATADREQAVTAVPKDPATVVAGTTAAQLALGASRSLYQRSPAAVLVADGDQGSLTKATATAERLGVPLLVTPAAGGTAEAAKAAGDAVRAELDRLKVRTVVPVGTAKAWARKNAPDASGGDVAGIEPPTPLKDLVVLALDRPAGRAATATARATGARVVRTSSADPRADGDAVTALAKDDASRVLALGSDFGPADRLRARVDVAATGVQLPGGGQVVFPGRRMVALYGHPGSSALGSLGQQPLDEAIARAKRVAADYQPLSKEKVVPAFEIITTVSSSSAGGDGNYSNETSVDTLRPWVEAAHREGLYVVLDLQPGYTDFLTQAKRYASLLKLPNVGLALDPEWRLEPPQRPMSVIGSVGAAEVNRTAEWLADFTRKNHLPQKLLMLHQFRLDMISDRSAVHTDYDDIQVLIHADGFGTPGEKFETWNTLHRNAPADVRWGWKNFYRADSPTFTPRQTMEVSPTPVFVSYQ
ncbi:hypothetical protein SAMN05421678_10152 [Actinopolymorpha cephalotaxi]|uniref:Uncharacterized protein n=1 Tax=Actinopolymorpha cephalotaxi TaxID=504797 RepID=A0A1I2K5J2_9ACTN|nr:hypothetical protein [Actinopolymorpha cephalotaxi]NYH85936.1 hypothetical protein [Actinopolymorpha cephalotaxi]SFF62174.1 hypothetical protein SAMN05421678_10152 [Actinopolymorpha cephalotaxi]